MDYFKLISLTKESICFTHENITIYLYHVPVDLRKGCDSLTSISSSIINKPLNNTLFVFLNRRRNRIKVLHHTKNNYSYWFIKIKKGVFAPKKFETSLITVEEMKNDS